MAPGVSLKGYVVGPDDRRLRIVERIIETDDRHRYVVEVAAPIEEVETDIRSFNVALEITLAILAAALILSTLLQVQFGLVPLRRLGGGKFSHRAALHPARRRREDRGTFPA